jgi:hypothetical protein
MKPSLTQARGRLARPSHRDAVAMLGPSRSLGYRPDVTYSGRFSIGVDVLAWDNGIDQAFGPFWYAQNLQLGAVYQIKKLYSLGFPRNRDRLSFPKHKQQQLKQQPTKTQRLPQKG